MSVLIDSSVWIAASNSKNRECLILKRKIRAGESIIICRPIQVEICQGAKTEQEFHRLWESLLGFGFLDISDRIWGMSAYNYFKCRKKGLTLSTLDCLIGTLASEYKTPLWTLDATLQKAATVMGFELYFPT